MSVVEYNLCIQHVTSINRQGFHYGHLFRYLSSPNTIRECAIPSDEHSLCLILISSESNSSLALWHYSRVRAGNPLIVGHREGCSQKKGLRTLVLITQGPRENRVVRIRTYSGQSISVRDYQRQI